jgi:hypothetical protein
MLRKKNKEKTSYKKLILAKFDLIAFNHDHIYMVY